ncbi:chitin binding domain-containing protein [Biscogniauxia mediterranea]|nr:chitin binding domain-containing protein [Biscogniauxia mediterranea]
MKSSTTTIISFAGFVSTALGHGFVTTPQARMPGDAMAAACGQQVEINQKSDNYGNIQGELQVASSQSDYNAEECNIWLCKGYKFADNTANVQTYTAGQVVPFVVDIRAPHTGIANVTIVSTATNTVIGSTLKSWDVYASNASPIPDDQKNFNITIPSDLGSQCATAGDCVIQWQWDAQSIDQTYQSCVDFTVGSSGSSSSSSGSSSSSAASSSTSTAAPTQTVTAAAVSTSTTAATPTSTASATTTKAAFINTDGIPPSLLTSVISTVLPTAVSVPTQPLTEGTTLQDLIDWVNYLMSSVTVAKRHARDFFSK